MSSKAFVLTDKNGNAAKPPPVKIFQHHHNNSSHAQKSSRIRETGVEDKFKKTDHLLDFKRTLAAFFAKHDVTAGTCWADPDDSSTHNKKVHMKQEN